MRAATVSSRLVDALRRLELAPTQRDGYVDQQLIGLEWLGQVSALAEPQRRVCDLGIVPAGHHDRGDSRVCAAKLCDEVKP